MVLMNEEVDAIVSPITEPISAEGAGLSEIVNAPSAAPDVPVSRTICLRSLRGTNTVVPSSSAPSVAGRSDMSGWGKPLIPSLRLVSSPVVSAKERQNVGHGVPMANKVVDLREVKKARPVQLATSTGTESEELEESSSSQGPMKLDVSACKRMIKYQLKKNEAEERREATRYKMEKERACAAEEEETQRTLKKIEARIEAQRRGPFSVLKNGSHAKLDNEVISGDLRGGGCSIPEDDLRELSSKHGLVVKFIDDGEASGVEQVRALARAHGIRIEILDGTGDGGPRPATPATTAASNDVTTPPPVLSSLNAKPKVPVVAGTKRVVGTSRLRKAAQALTAQAPRASNANLEIVSDNGSVAKGGVSAGSAERKRRQPSDDCVQKEKRTGGLCEGGNSVAEPKSMPVETSASKRMRCANPDGRVASQPDFSAAIATRSKRRSSTGTVPWTSGNSKLFEGAMAGIMGKRKPGRGKRP